MSVYAALGNEVNVTNTFSILAYLNIIRNPTILIPMTINALAEARVSIQRIHHFLTLDELPTRQRLAYDENIPYAIAVRNGSFLWAKDQTVPTLKDVTFNVKTGKLIAIIGSVGVGQASRVESRRAQHSVMSSHTNILAGAHSHICSFL